MTNYLIGTAILVGLIWAVYFYWRRIVHSELREGAEFEYSRFVKSDPDLLKGLDQAGFHAIFHRTEMPRRPLYVAGAVSTFLIGTPIFMGALAGLDYMMNRFGLIPRPADMAGVFLLKADGTVRFFKNLPEEGALMYIENFGGFFYFFGLLGFWLFILWFFMNHYYKNAPGALRDEIIRHR